MRLYNIRFQKVPNFQNFVIFSNNVRHLYVVADDIISIMSVYCKYGTQSDVLTALLYDLDTGY